MIKFPIIAHEPEGDPIPKRPHIGFENGQNISQDGPYKRSKKARIAKTNDFQDMCFDMMFRSILEHQASQESPKTAKAAPRTAPGSLQEPFNKKTKRIHF